jgi:hypothetical protein
MVFNEQVEEEGAHFVVPEAASWFAVEPALEWSEERYLESCHGHVISMSGWLSDESGSFSMAQRRADCKQCHLISENGNEELQTYRFDDLLIVS